MVAMSSEPITEAVYPRAHGKRGDINLHWGDGTRQSENKERNGEGLDRNGEEKGQIMEEGNSRHSTPPLPPHPRHTSSKYDFVKVRVWLGDNADHYYVLSRFLVCRMLMVTKIPNHVAIKISLELKKLLIDNSLLDVSQTDLEANLFKLMERRGYGEEFISRYKMMTRFHHQRVPLVILVCGTACVGKSTIATQLAQRLNLPNVLQTDMVYELIRTSTDAPLTSTPVWEREFTSPKDLVTEFARECRIVRKGLDGDLNKAMKDGKPIIIEGIHLDPSIYLMDEENGGVTSLPSTSTINSSPEEVIYNPDTKEEASKGLVTTDQGSLIHSEKNALPAAHVSSVSRFCASDEGASTSINPARNSIEKLQRDAGRYFEGDSLENAIVGTGLIAANPGGDDSAGKQIHRSPAKAIVVPIVLKMDEFDHKTLLEEWITCRSASGVLTTEAEKEKLVSKLMTIQDYLCSFESQGMTVVNISATTFPQTLDWLHSYLLQCIEEGCHLVVTSHPHEVQELGFNS